MADDETGTPDATSGAPDPDSGATPGGQQTPKGATPGGSSEKGAKPDTQLGEAGQAALEKERANRRDAERKAAEYRNRIAELEDASKPELERAQAQAERAANEAEIHRQRIAELEGEIAKRDLDQLKRQVAAEHQLPAVVASRLQGTDLRSLRADAKDLAEQIRDGQPAGSFGIGQGGTAAGGNQRVSMNDLIREAAGRG